MNLIEFRKLWQKIHKYLSLNNCTYEGLTFMNNIYSIETHTKHNLRTFKKICSWLDFVDIVEIQKSNKKDLSWLNQYLVRIIFK